MKKKKHFHSSRLFQKKGEKIEENQLNIQQYSPSSIRGSSCSSTRVLFVALRVRENDNVNMQISFIYGIVEM